MHGRPDRPSPPPDPSISLAQRVAAPAFQPAAELFASPCCRKPLTTGGDGFECGDCGRTFPIEDGLVRFVTGKSSHGEFSAAEMDELLATARRDGWRVALAEYAAPRRPRVGRLITDPRRRNALIPLENVGGRVLDFGCGYGGVSLALATMFDEVVAVDGSERRVGFLNIVCAQERLDNITPVCHFDAARLPFPDNHFDAVTLIGVLEYLPQGMPEADPVESQIRCLGELRRVLRPGGRLLIHTKNRFGWPYWLGSRDHSSLRFSPLLPRAVADRLSQAVRRRPYRVINHSAGGYRRLLRRAGFEDLAFYWPVPGYQTPDQLLALDDDLAGRLAAVGPRPFGDAKYAVLRALCGIGLLSLLVPHYGILAVRPAEG